MSSNWLNGMAQDIRYAARGLRLKPGFTLAVMATLGLGIGANATMFGIVDRLLFRPPTYLHSPELVHRLYMGRVYQGKEIFTSSFQYPRYKDVERWAPAFDAALAYSAPTEAVGVGAATKQLTIGSASASLWKFFDVKPVIGRFFTAAEDVPPAGTLVAVLSYNYWQSEYAGRNDVLGKLIDIGPGKYTIIGVAPRGFAGMSSVTPAAFVPITAEQGMNGFTSPGGAKTGKNYSNTYNMSWLELYARRRPGVSMQAATRDLDLAFHRSYLAQLEQQPQTTPIAIAKPHGVVAPIPYERGPNQSSSSKVALWLLGVAGIVLLIACANVANLLLARAIQRRREVAVRIALGVSRTRLLRQLFTESLMLAVLGAVAGLLFAQWGGGILRAALLPSVEWTHPIADGRVLLFSSIVALGAGLLAGLAPAFQSGRADITSSLKLGPREGGSRHSRVRSALLVTQAAFSVVLLVGAGLFVRSLRNVQHLDLGYDAQHLVWVSPELRTTKLDSAQTVALHLALLDRARSVPGVAAAARGVSLPFWMTWENSLFVQGIDSVSRLGEFKMQAVSPGYFATTGTPILRGRAITDEDRAGAPRAVVVSQSMAAKLWPGKDPIGQCMRMNADTMPCNYVVGVAHDIKDGSLDDSPALHYYLSDQQYYPNTGGIFVRVRDDATRQAEAVRRAMQQGMPGDAYVTVHPFSEILDGPMRSWKLGAAMFAVFGAVALLLAAMGLYSVVAYSVTQRTHEMGVRIALGADARDLLGLVLREGLSVALLGIGIGALLALGGAHWLAPLLFNESARDPAVFVAVALVLALVAAAASLVPALRASRVDPAEALRAD